jgi:hypothetical protein
MAEPLPFARLEEPFPTRRGRPPCPPPFQPTEKEKRTLGGGHPQGGAPTVTRYVI